MRVELRHEGCSQACGIMSSPKRRFCSPRTYSRREFSDICVPPLCLVSSIPLVPYSFNYTYRLQILYAKIYSMGNWEESLRIYETIVDKYPFTWRLHACAIALWVDSGALLMSTSVDMMSQSVWVQLCPHFTCTCTYFQSLKRDLPSVMIVHLFPGDMVSHQNWNFREMLL